MCLLLLLLAWKQKNSLPNGRNYAAAPHKHASGDNAAASLFTRLCLAIENIVRVEVQDLASTLTLSLCVIANMEAK